jgi:hypothetical protein
MSGTAASAPREVKRGPAEPFGWLERYWLSWAIVLATAGLALVAGHALTKIPHSDEGDIASAAVSLLQRGKIAFPMEYNYVASVREEYFIPPFYPYALSGWFTIFGHSFESYRLFHVAWWAILIVASIRLSWQATGLKVTVPIAAALFALNYDLLNLSVSRYDVVCCALNGGAMAFYAGLRASRLRLAVLLACICLALSALTHPFAIFGLVGCLGIAVGCGDWRRVDVVTIASALAPFAIGFAGWALLIGNQGDVFIAQMAEQSKSKTIDWSHPMQVFLEDVAVRWWELFAGWRESVPVVMRGKTVFLVVWAAALPLALAHRTDDTRGLRIGLVSYSVAVVLLLPLIDRGHLQIYNIHAIVGLTAAAAIVLTDMFLAYRSFQWPIILGVSALCAVGAFGIAGRISQQELQREYMPAAHLLATGIGPSDFVIAPPEFGFALGFQDHVRSDLRLTSLGQGGAMPRFIVESMDMGVGRTPTSVPCAVGGVATNDSTLYTRVPLEAPRGYYSVYRRSDAAVLGESRATEGTLRITRDCRTS